MAAIPCRGLLANTHLMKKLIALSLFQTSALLLYIMSAWIKGSVAPIIVPSAMFYTNPLPHVLMLTAIVVGVATISVGLALTIRIRHAFDTLDEAKLKAHETSLAKGDAA